MDGEEMDVLYTTLSALNAARQKFVDTTLNPLVTALGQMTGDVDNYGQHHRKVCTSNMRHSLLKTISFIWMLIDLWWLWRQTKSRSKSVES